MKIKTGPIANHIRNRNKRKFKWSNPENPLILIIAYADWASLGLRLSKAINKYTNWKSECISHHSNVIHNSLTEVGANDNIKKSRHITKLMNDADVVIFVAGATHYRPLGAYMNKNAYIGVWHIGTDYRIKCREFTKRVHPKIDIICVGKSFSNIEDDALILPALLDVEKYRFKERKYDKIIICHSPTNRIKKGTHIFIDSMEMLKKKFGDRIDFDIIEKVSNDECLERKKKCHIFFDQIANPDISYPQLPGEISMYGVSLLEAAAFGLVCMSHADFPDTPLICVKNKDDICNTVSSLINDKDKLKRLSKETREWIVNEHSYESIAERFISDIENRIKEINNG